MPLTERGESFGSLLREYRLAAGLSQEMLAERARLSVDAIGALERGIRRVPQRQTLALLIDALGASGSDRARLEAAAVREPQPRMRGSPQPTAANNLPRSLTSFVGREDDVAALHGLLASAPLVTITGPGGVGKTRLAIETACAELRTFSGGAWLVALAPLEAPASVAEEIASTVSVQTTQRGNVLDELADALRDRRVLLILDNCEHVLDETAFVVSVLLDRCANLRVLATSRERLRVEGEQVYPLRPLEAHDDAQSLFVQRARTADPSFTLTDENRNAVAGICARLDGLPLAIELAAAKVAFMSADDVLAGLAQPFSLLVDGRRGAPPRHQTLRALIDWSFRLLPEAERALLPRLAVFPSSWNEEACAAVAGMPPADAQRTLHGLAARSLVVREPSGDEAQFRLLETVREYARARLAEDDAAEAVERAFVHYVAAGVARAAQTPAVKRDAAWYDGLARQYDAIRASLRWAISEDRDPSLGARMAVGLSPFWYGRRLTEGKRWFTLLLENRSQLDVALRGEVLLRCLQMDPFRADGLSLATEAVDAFRAVGALAELADALEFSGEFLVNIGRSNEALTPLREAIQVAREAGDASVLVKSMTVIGFAYVYLGELELARELFDDAMNRAIAAAAPGRIAMAHLGRSELERVAGNAALAVAEAQMAVDQFEALGHESLTALARSTLAYALLGEKRFDDARACAERALEELSETLLPIPFLEALVAVAAARVGSGDVPLESAFACIEPLRDRSRPFRMTPLAEREYELVRGAIPPAAQDARTLDLMSTGDLRRIAQAVVGR